MKLDLLVAPPGTTPTRRVGTIDCETLSLRTNAIVYEVGFLGGDVDEAYRFTGPIDIQRITLDIWSQVEGRRHLDPDTVGWAIQTYGLDGLHRQVSGTGPMIESPYRMVPSQACAEIQRWTKGLDELWINKSSFDYSVLQSLSEQFFLGKPLWAHKSELDLRTLYRKLPIGSEKNTAPGVHTALIDCIHNFDILQKFGAWITGLNPAAVNTVTG